MPPPPFTRDGLALPDSTLRQTIRVSAGARQIRLRLSNAFGTADLRVARVGVARPGGARAGVSSIEAGSARAVTFGGRAGVVVPPGGEAVSDPVDFPPGLPLAAGANLTVSLALPDGQRSDGGITTHAGSRTTSHVAPGDQASEPDLAGAAAVEHWYFLSGVDAYCRPGAEPGPGAGRGPGAAAVFLGDSLTDGRGSTTDGNDRWPDALLDLMRSRQEAGRVALLNLGIGGNRVLRDGLGPAIVSRLGRDVLAIPGARWLVLFAGVNDIGGEPATPAAQRQVTGELCAAYEQIAVKAHAAGILAVGATLTPFGGHPYDDPAGHREAARQAVNTWIRGSGHYDTVLDFDDATRAPQAPRRLRPQFDSGDALHLNPAGYRALANAVPYGLFT